MKLPSLQNLETTRGKSIVLLVLTAILWSSGGFLIKWVKWNPLAIAGMRSAIAALLMLAIIRKPKLPASFSQIAGALGYTATVILFVTANKLTTAANAILLQYTAPIYVAILGAIFLKERVKKSDIVTIALVIGGMFLFFLDDLGGGSMVGNILGLLSGIAFAIMIVCLRSQKSASPLETVFWGNVATALIGLPFMFGSMPDASGWTGLILLGIFQLGLAYILYTTAIKKVTALEGILIPVLEPILNPIIVVILLGEVPGMWSLIGGAIVLLSITFRCVLAVAKPAEFKDANASQ